MESGAVEHTTALEAGAPAADSGYRHPSCPWSRSYDPPADLHGAIVSLNIGRAGEKFAITVQGLDYREMGGHFAMMEPDEELLAALRGSEYFLEWFETRLLFHGTIRKGTTEEHQVIGFMDGTVIERPKDMN